MERKKYTIEERNEAQLKSMDLKKKGYYVTRLKENMQTVAFGYRPSTTDSIKTSMEKEFSNVDLEDFEFIYWN